MRQDRIAELSTILSPETGNIEIRSRERLSNDDWTVHAVARVRKTIDAVADERAAPVAGEVKSVLTAEKTYETAERFGLQYGPHFRLLSKAVAFGHGLIEVDLKTAKKAAHPYLSYNLNPMSVDAAFHGLVALFDQLSGDQAGAPYIPVRFGSVRVRRSERPVVKATIGIERFSQNSIKVRFRMFDDAGTQVAAFDDCRFRRTYLRRHQTLDSVAFHYESVPSALFAATSDIHALPVIAGALDVALNNATLLLDAAVYRACHEIALALAAKDGSITIGNLPGDAAFRSFLTSCLFSLEDAGIASSDDGKWTVATEFTLPPSKRFCGNSMVKMPPHRGSRPHQRCASRRSRENRGPQAGQRHCFFEVGQRSDAGACSRPFALELAPPFRRKRHGRWCAESEEWRYPSNSGSWVDLGRLQPQACPGGSRTRRFARHCRPA
ncbi:hypothetical protein AJ87_08570 [Rhizobium yanglingense]|nr:hypothetical protein AJ87_08570 [Rhizobium yanglingense]